MPLASFYNRGTIREKITEADRRNLRPTAIKSSSRVLFVPYPLPSFGNDEMREDMRNSHNSRTISVLLFLYIIGRLFAPYQRELFEPKLFNGHRSSFPCQPHSLFIINKVLLRLLFNLTIFTIKFFDVLVRATLFHIHKILRFFLQSKM